MLIDSRPASRRCDSRMMPMKATVIILLFCIQEAVWAIPLSEFYPYGLNSLEATGRMGNGHNTFSPRILTQKLFFFYGQQHESVVVSCIYKFYVLIISDGRYADTKFLNSIRY